MIGGHKAGLKNSFFFLSFFWRKGGRGAKIGKHFGLLEFEPRTVVLVYYIV
jgi:hypothetical protein